MTSEFERGPPVLFNYQIFPQVTSKDEDSKIEGKEQAPKILLSLSDVCGAKTE